MNGKNILEEIQNNGFSLDWLTNNFSELCSLKGIPQNPDYHAEGDAYTHTELVCKKLTNLYEWQELNSSQRALLYLAAAFHDIGKSVCTKQENGTWVSPKHTLIGEKLFRQITYRNAKKFGLTFKQRETIAKLIRYHGLPVWFWTKKRPEFALLKAAESVPLQLLYLLSKADAEGRICNAPETLIEQIELFADFAKEQNVWETPYAFTDAYTKFCYFQKEDLWKGSSLYNNTEFDVILMSGLPLSGKDSWIEKNGANLPVISLDQIREDNGISPSKGSEKAVQIAMEQARALLRRKEPFIWNATNLIEETRQKLVRLFSGYGARVHILYLEAPYQELLVRNQKRARYIPEPVLEKMIQKLEIPQPWEGYSVTWFSNHDTKDNLSANALKNICQNSQSNN